MDFSNKKPTSCHLFVKIRYSGLNMEKTSYVLEDDISFDLKDLNPSDPYYELVEIADHINPITDKPEKSFLNNVLGYNNRTYACYNSNAEYEDATVIDAYFKFGFDGPTVSEIVSDFINMSLETKNCQGWCGEIKKGCKCYNPSPSFIPSSDNNKVIPGYFYQRYNGKGSENSGYYREPNYKHKTKPVFIPSEKFRGEMLFYSFRIDRDINKTGYYLEDNYNIRRTPPSRKAPRLPNNDDSESICKHFKNGNCAFGDRCKFIHN